MIRFARDFRLIPIVLLAAVCLLALKVSGLILDGGYTLGQRIGNEGKGNLQIVPPESVPEQPTIVFADKAPGSKSWAQEMFNYRDNRDVTGSVGGDSKPPPDPALALKVTEKPADTPKLTVGTTPVPMENGRAASAGERAVLERLQDRREQLDSRGRELEMRESLIKAAEKRMEAKIGELKDMESKVNDAMAARDKAEIERFKGVVSMYENMKPKDAARIFDRLELKVLVDVATQMSARKMSEVLASMSPEGAERLTVELARRATAVKGQSAEQLPKIEGKPSGL